MIHKGGVFAIARDRKREVAVYGERERVQWPE